jgi:hypothetical protein
VSKAEEAEDDHPDARGGAVIHAHPRRLATSGLTRRRSRRLKAPATKAKAEATPLGSISGTELELNTETL